MYMQIELLVNIQHSPEVRLPPKYRRRYWLAHRSFLVRLDQLPLDSLDGLDRRRSTLWFRASSRVSQLIQLPDRCIYHLLCVRSGSKLRPPVSVWRSLSPLHELSTQGWVSHVMSPFV